MVTTLTPEEVRAKYGKMFCKALYTLVDEKHGKARVIETCSARGPAEWDVVNRRRSGGVINVINIEGTTIIMDVTLGEKEIKFGAASAEMGGQGLKACRVEGDEVRTTWYGIAGASVGIGACLPGCDTVLRTEFPDEFKIGGGHTAHVDIFTPKLIRVIIGVDDTDTKEKGATWATSLAMARECPYGHFMEHKIIQLNPRCPTKTTNCVATAVSFAIREDEVPKLIEFCYDYIKSHSYSEDAVMTVFKGLEIPSALRKFGWDAKSIMYKVEDAEKIAAESGVEIISVTGTGGIIGAVAAIGCADLGTEAAGVAEDFQ